MCRLTHTRSSSRTSAVRGSVSSKRKELTRRWLTYESGSRVRFGRDHYLKLTEYTSQTVTWTATRRRSESHFGWALVLHLIQARRYVAKVIFTYILGYKVDVGHMEAVNLISSPKYSEKQIVRFPTFALKFVLQRKQGLSRSHSPHARKLRLSAPRSQFNTEGLE